MCRRRNTVFHGIAMLGNRRCRSHRESKSRRSLFQRRIVEDDKSFSVREGGCYPHCWLATEG